MDKIIMTLTFPKSKVRKPQAKLEQKHKDKTKYTRKAKHKAPEWGLCCMYKKPGKTGLLKSVR